MGNKFKEQAFDIAKNEAQDDFLYEINSNSKSFVNYLFGNSRITSLNFEKSKTLRLPKFDRTEHNTYSYRPYNRRYGRCKTSVTYTQYNHTCTIYYMLIGSNVKFFFPKNIIITKRLNLIEKFLKKEEAKKILKSKIYNKFKINKNDKSTKPFFNPEKENNLRIIAQCFGQEFANAAAKWQVINKSPYSNSFYDSNDISWNHKPELSLRISDHWNFFSQGTQHCKLTNTVEQINQPMIAAFISGAYHPITIN